MPGANSGMWRATGSSSSRSPRSRSWPTATAATGLAEESQSITWPGVRGSPGRFSPTAASATTSPPDPRET